MKLTFNIEYYTQDGQQLVVCVPNPHQKDGKTDILCYMKSTDGKYWTSSVDYKAAVGSALNYSYGVLHNGKMVRHEWQVVTHRLEFCARKADQYVVYDHWIDLPEDAHLYTSAVTDCLVGAVLEAPKPHSFRQTVRLKVRAPQLRKGESLTIVGSDPLLGNWQPQQSLPMTRHHINEWIVDIDVEKLSSRRLEFKFQTEYAPRNITLLWEQGENRIIDLPEVSNGEVLVYELPQARFDIPDVRCAGTLVPVFSLRSKTSFGVGDFGDLRKMIDWVSLTRQRVLQVLPINDTTQTHKWTDCYPYSCISIFALHPLYADLTQLPEVADKKVKKELETLRKELNGLPQIDYERVIAAKLRYLRIIFEQEGQAVLASKAFKDFFAASSKWLVPYAQYCYLRDANGSADFSQWKGHASWNEKDRKRLSTPTTKAFQEVAFYYYVQFVLCTQMKAVHQHARTKGIILKGDIPIGVNRCGCDVWSEPRYFNLNGQTGAPPDEFATDGQNWGFPTYNWDEMLADGCEWWVRRFQNMSNYFDAYRIDHVLGFFRIWEIPWPERSGLLGQFSPALALTQEEIESAGLWEHKELFLADHKDDSKWHPRIAIQLTDGFKQLPESVQQAFNRLYDDYFYHRNNQYWYEEAMKKLPKLINATRMLVCAEDLGMVPECVGWVMNELKMLSLEIQSMPKEYRRFGRLSHNPYRSVCTISSHDMPTLRQWWDEDEERTQDYYQTILRRSGEAPHPLPGWLARDIISRHLTCLSMLCILSIQDWLAMDEQLRLPDANAERINIPANPHHYWRYRMHINIEDLMKADAFNAQIIELIQGSRRLFQFNEKRFSD